MSLQPDSSQITPLRSPSTIRFTRYELALIGVTMLWGGTFLVIHHAMDYVGPAVFVGVRFLFAGLVAAAVFYRALRSITRNDVFAGLAIGTVMAIGYVLQTAGLQTISSSMSGFITAFYVPLVPLAQWLFLRRRPGKWSLIGAGLAFVGLLLLGNPGSGGFSFGIGELLTIVSAVVFAAEIILISAFAGNVDYRSVTVVQLLVAGFVALTFAGISAEQAPQLDWRWLVPALALGAASVLIQLGMNWAQRHVTATRATIIYSAEPVWAGLFGWLAGDRLPALALVGAAVIITGVLISEIRTKHD